VHCATDAIPDAGTKQSADPFAHQSSDAGTKQSADAFAHQSSDAGTKQSADAFAHQSSDAGTKQSADAFAHQSTISIAFAGTHPGTNTHPKCKPNTWSHAVTNAPTHPASLRGAAADAHRWQPGPALRDHLPRRVCG
jgi:hypothetical protein